jgi:hypothetical protein
VQAAIKAAIVKAAIAIWLRTIVLWVWVVVWVGGCVGGWHPHAAIMARRVRDRAAVTETARAGF